MRTKLVLFMTLFILPGIFIQAKKPKMTKIFNGKDFSGWEVPENNIWWTASKGIMSAKSGPNKKGSILWTKKDYRDFVVQLQFRMGDGTIDSGIFLRAESPQVQIGISGSLKRDMTASPYVPGKGYPVEAKGVKDLLKMKGWNKMKVELKGNTFKVWLNGKMVMTYTAEKMEEAGPIGLQLHPNNEMSIDFRKIKVAEL